MSRKDFGNIFDRLSTFQCMKQLPEMDDFLAADETVETASPMTDYEIIQQVQASNDTYQSESSDDDVEHAWCKNPLVLAIIAS